MQNSQTLGRLVALPENEAARALVPDLLSSRRPASSPYLILLHGPGGTGKTHFVAGFLREAGRHFPGTVIHQASANDWKILQGAARSAPPASERSTVQDEADESPHWLDEARAADILVIEDLQHLPEKAAASLIQLLDDRQDRRLLTVLTSRLGPRQLGTQYPARLTSRLAGGLTVTLEAWSAASKLRVLEELAQRCQLAVSPEILEWLAEHLPGGGHQLEGAISQLATLRKFHDRPLRLAEIRKHFLVQVDAARPSLERIVEQVGDYFHVEPRELVSHRRIRAILVPRQIGMYLARRLTALSYQQIGSGFGGHDHTTVLHACRKVEKAVRDDALLSGAVEQLQAELS